MNAIPQEKLIEAYCQSKSKEEIINDLKIDEMDEKQHHEFLLFVLKHLSSDTIKDFLNTLNKEDIVNFIKSSNTTKRVKESKYTLLEKTMTNKEDMLLVMTDEVPQWYRNATSAMENGIFTQRWRSRYWALLKVLRSGRQPYMYSVLIDAYNKAVEEVKNKNN